MEEGDSSHLPADLDSRGVGVDDEASECLAGRTFGVWVGPRQEEVPEKGQHILGDTTTLSAASPRLLNCII